MIRALLYLQTCSTANRLLTRIKRLKKPKYLAGFLVGGLYFYFYFFRYFFFPARKPGASGANAPELSPEILAGLESVGAAFLLVLVVLKWVLPHQRAALAFSEAEVSFLFPAPVRRRTLIHFKLLKSQFGILFSTLLMALLSRRFDVGGAAWGQLAGWWLLFSTLNLHFLGASFARTRLLDAGITHTRRRVIIISGLALLFGVTVFWASRTMSAPAEADLASGEAMWIYLTEVLNTGAASVILLPFRLLMRPLLAADGMAFLGAVWPTVVLLGLHYLWVIRSDVAFEEASADLARRRAEQIATIRQGGQPLDRKPRRAPFSLAPLGSAPVAFLWKNLISAGSFFTPRMWLILACAFGIPAAMFAWSAPKSAGAPIMGMMALMGLVWSLLAGPHIFRQDFRQDLRQAEILKLYPLAGWRVVLGELLAPAVLLAAVQWLLLFVGLLVVTRGPEGTPIPFGARLAIVASAALMLPLVNLVSLLIPNAAVLLFPAWFQTGPEAAHGVEATGQRLILAVGQLLVFLAALIPAGLASGAVFFLVQYAASWVLAVPVASVMATLVLAVEAAVGIGLLGKAFERFDPSADPQV